MHILTMIRFEIPVRVVKELRMLRPTVQQLPLITKAAKIKSAIGQKSELNIKHWLI